MFDAVFKKIGSPQTMSRKSLVPSPSKTWDKTPKELYFRNPHPLDPITYNSRWRWILWQMCRIVLPFLCRIASRNPLLIIYRGVWWNVWIMYGESCERILRQIRKLHETKFKYKKCRKVFCVIQWLDHWGTKNKTTPQHQAALSSRNGCRSCRAVAVEVPNKAHAYPKERHRQHQYQNFLHQW